MIYDVTGIVPNLTDFLWYMYDLMGWPCGGIY